MNKNKTSSKSNGTKAIGTFAALGKKVPASAAIKLPPVDTEVKALLLSMRSGIQQRNVAIGELATQRRVIEVQMNALADQTVSESRAIIARINQVVKDNGHDPGFGTGSYEYETGVCTFTPSPVTPPTPAR